MTNLELAIGAILIAALTFLIIKFHQLEQRHKELARRFGNECDCPCHLPGSLIHHHCKCHPAEAM